jgi:alanyl-tRNA synthetase
MATHRIYYDDAYEREFTAKVLSCEAIPPDLKAGRTQQAWAVVLDRTALYPTSGGQPHDLGKLGDGAVLDVRDDGEEVVHIVDRRLEAGPVAGCVDWNRRFDHMQQHTGQHLLSAMFQERFGLPTLSFHLGEDFCTIDLRGPEPSDEILEGAERAANTIIFEDRAITVRYATEEQLAEMGVRKQVQREGILRVIEITGADLQPCGGTHVRTTGQIGLVLVRRRSKVRQDWRIEFVCGGRAERAARADFRNVRNVAQQLNCAPDEAADAAKRLAAERDAHFASLRATLERLALAEAALTLQSFADSAEEPLVVERVIDGTPPEYLSLFAAALVKRAKVVALVASAESGDVVFAQHAAASHDMAALVKRVLAEVGGKGGGARNFARGKVSDIRAVPKAIELARTLLSSVSRIS